MTAMSKRAVSGKRANTDTSLRAPNFIARSARRRASTSTMVTAVMPHSVTRRGRWEIDAHGATTDNDCRSSAHTPALSRPYP